MYLYSSVTQDWLISTHTSLKRPTLRKASTGEYWIMTERQKTGSPTNFPLLPQALAIIKKYKDHPLCLERDTYYRFLQTKK